MVFHSLTIYHFFLGGVPQEWHSQIQKMWIKCWDVAFFTKDLSWKDAGLSFETYLTDALEKVPWIGDGLCVGCSVPLEQVMCWGTFDDLASLCSGIDRHGVISNQRRCPPPLGQNIGEMAVLPVGNASNMHMLHMSLFFWGVGKVTLAIRAKVLTLMWTWAEATFVLMGCP